MMKSKAEIKDIVERYSKLVYPTQISLDKCDGEPCFFVTNPDLLGCSADGKTQEEALDNLDQVRREYFEVLLEGGASIPLPSPILVPYAPMPSNPHRTSITVPGSSTATYLLPRPVMQNA